MPRDTTSRIVTTVRRAAFSRRRGRIYVICVREVQRPEGELQIVLIVPVGDTQILASATAPFARLGASVSITRASVHFALREPTVMMMRMNASSVHLGVIMRIDCHRLTRHFFRQ